MTVPEHEAVGEDRSHAVLQAPRRDLDAIFRPRSIAIVGASETRGSVGRTILWNLLSHPSGATIHPVNNRRTNVLGVRAYPTVRELPDTPDLVVIATPAPTVPGVIADCVEAGAQGAIIISAGFKEVGREGAELERQVLETARRGALRLIGPNCLGVMNPQTGLNATFAGAMAMPGHVGFISQSGALCTAVLDWSIGEQVGFSAFLSIGSMLDVGWGDLIDYLGDDPRTHSIVIYMETIGDARSFMSAAREVTRSKPIIVIKPGRTEAAAQAAASHTGSLAGSDEVLDAAFRRCGVLRVERISEIFNLAELVSKQPRPKGRRLTIVTNAGGPGVLATDALIEGGGELAEIAEPSRRKLNELLPAHWSHGNPIDVLGDAGAERYAKTLDVLAEDPNSDGYLVVLTPQAMTDPLGTADALRTFPRLGGKPIIASWMGGDSVAAGVKLLNQAGIPTFDYPDTAARAFCAMWRHDENLRALYETPDLTDLPDEPGPNRDLAEQTVTEARESGRTLLNEYESKRLLAAYGIPTVETRVAASATEAVEAAEAIGYPVAIKLHSNTITHKADVGGVLLNLDNAEAVSSAFESIRNAVKPEDFLGVTVQRMVATKGYELIVGSSIDPQFGPVLLFGLGGTLVEVFRDHALGLPPLNTTLARRMMERTKIWTALDGVRGRRPVDKAALARLMVRFSQLVIEQPWIRELDINPLLASESGLIALDARVILFGAEVGDADLPRPAIRPYPVRYIQAARLRNGTELTLRPIRPEDEPLMVEFHQSLSEDSVYARYFQSLKLSRRIAHERLTRICFIDYDREIAIVAERPNPETGRGEILGVGRLSRTRQPHVAEFALLIADAFQGQGLGSELLGQLIEIARDMGIQRLDARILANNHPMRRLCQRLDFRLRHDVEEGVVVAELNL